MASKELAVLVLIAACQKGGEPHAQAPNSDGAPDANLTSAAPSPLDPPALHVVLDDPRFATARERARERDWAGAASAMHDVKSEDPCAAAYVEGRMRALADDATGAAEAFDRAAQSECPLAAYASFRAALAWGKQGRADEAIARAKKALAAPEPIANADEASLVLAEAESAKGHKAEALALWRASSAAHPKGARWVDTEVRVATSLLGGDEGDPKGHAKEALDRATRVMVEAPLLAESVGAPALRARARALLPGEPAELAPADRARRAQVLADLGKGADAHKEAELLIPLVKRDAGLSCKVHTLRAQTAAKVKADAAAAWGDAIAACTGDGLAQALYSGGKASASKKPREALDRFARLEKELPEHRLADDARFHGALIHLDQGELAEFHQRMGKLPDDYPKGDMKGEALFRVALQHLTRGDTAAAETALARGLALDAGNHHWASAGRFAYFQTRIKQQKGEIEGVKSGYQAIVREHPMQFYMFQAYARLAALDGALAKKTLDDALAAEPAGTLLTREHEAMKKPAFTRALRLLEVGEIDAAKKEMASTGATADSADSELVYAVGELFARAGAPEIAVSWARARVTEHLQHAPSGRWRRAWEAAYPRAFEDAVRKAAKEEGIPVSLAWAIMREESGFHAEAKSPSGALGLMQLMPGTARMLASTMSLPYDDDALKRADISIAFGTHLLGSLRGTYKTLTPLAIAAYNAGSGAVNRWLASSDFDVWVERIPYDETRGYLKRVLASQGTYAMLYASGELGEVLALPERVTKP